MMALPFTPHFAMTKHEREKNNITPVVSDTFCVVINYAVLCPCTVFSIAYVNIVLSKYKDKKGSKKDYIGNIDGS